MNKIIRVSSLSRLFGIEQESWDDYPYPNDGYFDAQLNYHFGDEYFPSILFPWNGSSSRRLWSVPSSSASKSQRIRRRISAGHSDPHANPDNMQALYGRNAPYRTCFSLLFSQQLNIFFIYDTIAIYIQCLE